MDKLRYSIVERKNTHENAKVMETMTIKDGSEKYTLLRKYHNLHIPKLTKAYYNTTKLHSMLLTNKILHSKLIRTSVDIFN